ncbi:hypothetical protein BGZ63DRAFT_395061 [Mariannaea sp. PMI_226]|nr:hypothetical protein BGZ63DRAFT_395061 [Mariannaea sp. PMI_226]
MSVSPEVLSDEASKYVANARFHHTFTLPATNTHDDLTFSFADLGRAPTPGESTPNPPTVLFMPGMYASRYLGVPMHAIADKLGVRVIIVDRPGMGKSTDVPLQQRVSIWVELVPKLLQHLGIQHVALASHSAGTVFLLNTLYQCRNILDPEKPFAALLAPWVDPLYSKNTAMQMAQYIPTSAFGIWHLIPQVFLKAAPALASSGAVATKASGMISGVSGFNISRDESEVERNRKQVEKVYGMRQELQVEIEKEFFKSMFSESTVGANSETLQCLRKSDWSWGECSDYSQFVKDLVGKEREKRSERMPNGEGRLQIRAYFAQDDALIGKRGQEYMEQCWKGTEEEGFQDVLDFNSTTVAGTNHDTVMQSADILAKIFVGAGGIPVNEPQ